MSRADQFISAARQVAQGGDVRQAVDQVQGRRQQGAPQQGRPDQQGSQGQGQGQGQGQQGQGQQGQRQGREQDTAFALSARDFPAARDQGSSAGTRIQAVTCSLHDAAEQLSRSYYEGGPQGPMHVITPMVMPKGRRWRAVLPIILLVVFGAVGALVLLPLGLSFAVFGPHYWILVLVAAAFLWWRQGMVMVPEGCVALISRFGKVEAEVGPGLVTLLNPWKRVSYIINVTREYPFNAPIRQAPTKSGVQASVDLFLQFRIVNAREFVFVLGAVQGYQDKLNNAISETTRSLIYEQEASGIYDLVGESTSRLLEQLNAQFAPAVELTTANITHAEPANQEYRMDLAAPEMVRVAKEAYTYEYELQLRKEQNEGDLNKDLASLNETLSAIQADIARYQAQMDTALERETNRADALAAAVRRGRVQCQRQRRPAGGPGPGHPGDERRPGPADPGLPLPARHAGPAGVARRVAAADRPGRLRHRRGGLPADRPAAGRRRRCTAVHRGGHGGDAHAQGRDRAPGRLP
ncbi:MAG: SPFH domain-containing protein [Ornithinimicrobium sp.]|uniref:SPFH domain-containing protein n=1 Tax=Ornithinimicrobium sp. TaxID=1977084 RepID=UPI003D9B9C74